MPYQLMSIMESMGQFKHLYSTMHRGTNNAIGSLIIPCWSVPDRNNHERGNLQREGLLTGLSVSPI